MECAKEEKHWHVWWWLVLRVHGDPCLFLPAGTLGQALAFTSPVWISLCCSLSPDHFHSSGSNEALPSAEKAPYLEEILGGTSDNLGLLCVGRARTQHLSAVPSFGFGGLVHHGITPGGLYCDRGLPSAWACYPRALLWDMSIMSRARLAGRGSASGLSVGQQCGLGHLPQGLCVCVPSPLRTLGREGWLVAGLQRLAAGLRGFMALLTLVWMCGTQPINC